ncbi:MAG: RNA-dependent DNA polymerase [bacterium]|nr:RNA-dependent DNA polymerase [bacterium]
MKRHGHLFEQIVTWDNFLSAAKKAAAGKTAKPAVARFLFHLEPEILTLQQELSTGSWRPQPYRSFTIREPKLRRISAADFRDRVVHHAIMNVLDPFFERALFAHSYACRVGKGTHAAVRYAQRQARRFPYFLKGDVDRYFETIDHAVLKNLLRRMFKDARLLALLDRIIDAPVPGQQPGQGLPIGNLTSQYFANHVLGQLDRFVKQRLRARGYLRFMDDVLIFAETKAELHLHRAAIRRYLADDLSLRLKGKATWLAPTGQGIPFLGFRIFPRTIRLQGQRWHRMRRRIRRRERAFQQGRISAEELATSVRSSVAHIEHAATRRLRRCFFAQSSALG